MPAVKGKVKPQIAKIMLLRMKKHMKDQLEAGEWKYGGRDSAGFRYYRRTVMSKWYGYLGQIYKLFVDLGLIEVCGCGATLEQRIGHTACLQCGGCGYKNTELLNDALAKKEGWSWDHFEIIKNQLSEVAQQKGMSLSELLHAKNPSVEE